MFTYVIAISCYLQLKVETLESMKHNRIICIIESVLLCDPIKLAKQMMRLERKYNRLTSLIP